MPDIARLLEKIREQNAVLGENLTAKGIEAAGEEGLVCLADKVRAIQQNIANGERKEIRVSAAGEVCAGDFAAYAKEPVAQRRLLAEQDCEVLGSGFFGSRRVAAALRKNGNLYLKAVGQDPDGTLALGNTVLVMEDGPDSAAVVGMDDAAAVVFAAEGMAYVSLVTYQGLTGTLQYTDAVDADDPGCPAACAVEDRELLVALLRDHEKTTYPEIKGVADVLLSQLCDYLEAAGNHWLDGSCTLEDYAEYLVVSDGETEAALWDALDPVYLTWPDVLLAKELIESINEESDTFTVPESLAEELGTQQPEQAFFHLQAEIRSTYIDYAKEQGKTVETLRVPHLLRVSLEEAGLEAGTAVPLAPCEADYDDYVQGLSVTTLNKNLAMAACFTQHDAPVRLWQVRLGADIGSQFSAACVTAGSMPCVSLIPLNAEACGVACAVKRLETPEKAVLTFEGIYSTSEYGMQPMFWGAETEQDGATVSCVYGDLLGEDTVVLTYLMDGTAYAVVVKLNDNRPSSGPTVPLGEAESYARLHALNSSYMLGVFQRDGGLEAVLYQLTDTVTRSGSELDTDALVSEGGPPGGTAVIYAAQ